MALGQSLQGGQRRRHFQVVGIRLRAVGHLFDHERTDTATIEVVYVAVSVVAFSMQGEKQRLFREAK